MENLLMNGGKLLNINISQKTLDQFNQYQDLLIQWNQKMNLTSITEKNEVIIKHFLDSIAGEIFIPNRASVIDVGTGAGFPGLPLKMIREDIHLTLLDSLQKRITFLQNVAAELNILDITFFHNRAEDAGHDTAYREQFDVAVARAVAPLNVLLEYCMPFVKIGGCFLAYKGKEANTEIENAENALKRTGGRIDTVYEVTLPDKNLEHKIIVVQKTAHCDKILPRKAGLPSKKPL